MSQRTNRNFNLMRSLLPFALSNAVQQRKMCPMQVPPAPSSTKILLNVFKCREHVDVPDLRVCLLRRKSNRLAMPYITAFFRYKSFRNHKFRKSAGFRLGDARVHNPDYKRRKRQNRLGAEPQGTVLQNGDFPYSRTAILGNFNHLPQAVLWEQNWAAKTNQ